MSHVFISYSRKDYRQAQALADALHQSRIPVWWDPEITLGERWEPAIYDAILAATAVVVLWSRNSVQSEWVEREATMAVEQGTLVPARLDPIQPPGIFGQFDSADLSNWDPHRPHRPHREFEQLRRHLLAMFGGGGGWQAERIDRETLLITLDMEQHTVGYSGGHLYVDGELMVKGLASVIDLRSFNFELRDGGRYYPARLDVQVTLLRGHVKRFTLSVGGTILYEG